MLGLRTPTGVDFRTFPDGSGPRLWVANRSLIDELAGAALATVEEAEADSHACRFGRRRGIGLSIRASRPLIPETGEDLLAFSTMWRI